MGFWQPEFLENLFRMLRKAAENLLSAPAGGLEEEKNRALLGAGAVLHEEKLCQGAKNSLCARGKDGESLLREFEAYWSNPFPEVLSDKGRS